MLRVVSLLPGLTDTVLALSMGESLCGISHECDMPAGWPELPRLTRCRIDDSQSSKAIDEEVRSNSGKDLYELDFETLARLQPDLILTQAQCDVCAISEETVAAAAARLPGRPTILAVNPMDMAGVCQMIRDVGSKLGRSQSASELIGLFEKLKQKSETEATDNNRLEAAHLEWLDPPMTSGHWNRELFQLARMDEITGKPGKASEVVDIDRLRTLLNQSDMLFLGICGFSVKRTLHELNQLSPESDLSAALQNYQKDVYAIDGHRLMVRPGPLLLTSVLAIQQFGMPPEDSGVPKEVGQLRLWPEATDAGRLEFTGGRWSIVS